MAVPTAPPPDQPAGSQSWRRPADRADPLTGQGAFTAYHIAAGALHVAFRRSDQAHAPPPLPSPSIRSSAGGRERWIRLREDGVGIAQRKSPDELVAQRMIARRRRAQNELVAQATGNVDRSRLGIETI